MFGHPIYRAAYERGVRVAASMFAETDGEDVPLELPPRVVNRITAELAADNEAFTARIAELALVGARNRWRELVTDSLRKSGIRARPKGGMAPAR
jgi:hypothetical protein